MNTRKSRQLRVYYQPSHPDRPMLRFGGLWLMQRVGLVPGDTIRLLAEPGRILITKQGVRDDANHGDRS